MKYTLNLILGILLCLTHASQFAQSPPDISKQINRLLQQQQQRENARNKQPNQSVFFARSKKKTMLSSNPSKPCFAVKTIKLKGAILIKQRDRKRLLSPYTQRCLSVNDINNIINSIGNYYLDRGYITSRAFVQEQDLSDGRLTLTVIEGKIGNIIISSGRQRHELKTAFPGLKGKHLNLRDIEMGIEQMNRLQSQNAKSNLLPAKELGVTNIQIEKKQTRPLHFTLTLDNHGSENTGKSLFSGNSVWDNPGGLNDRLTFGLNGTSKQAATRGSRGNSIAYQIPYGYTLLDLSYSKFNYKQPISGLNETFRSTGTSSHYKLDLDHIFHRNKHSKSKLTFAVGRKHNKNFIADTLINTSSRRLTVASLSLAHTRLFSRGSFDIKISRHQGLRWFGAEKNLGGDNPRAQFVKHTADVTYLKQFMTLGRVFRFKTDLRLQHANDNLYATEQVSIGGLHTVRGFAKNSLSGNSGWYWRNELSFGLKSKLKVTPYIAYDIGHINQDDRVNQGGTLAGMAVGFRIQGKYLSTDVSAARALVMPGDFIEDRVISASIRLGF